MHRDRPLLGSDHLPVIIELRLNTTAHSTPRQVWKFDDTKWQAWNNEIEKNSIKNPQHNVQTRIPSQSMEVRHRDPHPEIQQTTRRS